MNRIIALVVAIAIAVLAASSTVFVVDPRHAAVLSSRNGAAPTLAGPGLHFKLPQPLQAATLVDIRIQSFDLADPQSLTTQDGRDLLVSPVVRYRIADALKYYQQTGGAARGEVDRLSAAIKSALGDAFAKRARDAALGEQRAIAQEVKQALGAAAAPLGIDIVDVQLTRVDLPAAQADDAYRRITADLQQQAQRERAQGAAQAEQIRADASRQQQAILADAYKTAQSIKGDGDAQAASIAADAFGRDPQFYQFYASLQAYRNSFKPNDIIVVDPDSEFFRFMRSPTGGAPAAGTVPHKR
ncbi:protease modulator HflC [Burkholderia sp. TSV86]|uniref:protease modulator HflC n=1 Tax=Burkholderia sp. TSV86 TaxID=1385594 RepID=UPI0007565604|nr:protease modulator HflC [Burkholderia sp. TSV86]KVE32988.1 protease modulator HflC [Burkholderia sp. TSV86]